MALFLRQKQRLFVLASGGFFIASLVAGAIPIYRAALNPEPVQTQPIASVEEEFQAQARGFELVLQREPNNRVALEGLANARINLGDAKGAIAPLEALVKQFPDRVDYQALLKEAKQQANAPTSQDP